MSTVLRVNENDLDYDYDAYRPRWKGEWFTGVAYTANDLGEVLSEHAYTEGLLDGAFSRYDYNGFKYETGYYKQNIQHGVWKSWHTSIQLAQVSIYHYAVNNAYCRTYKWDEKGNLIYKEIIQPDEILPEGMYKLEQFWYSNGGLQSEKIYEHNILTEQKDWDEKGLLVKHYQLEASSPYYEFWQEQREAASTHNPFKLTK